MTDVPTERHVAEPKVPQSVIDAFEDRYRSLFNLDRDDHEWRNTWRYKHDHVQSYWAGWRDCYLAALTAPAGEVTEAAERILAQLQVPLSLMGGESAIFDLKDVGIVARAALTSNARQIPDTGGEGEAGERDDPSSDERWNEGVNYAITQLCHIFGVDPKAISWDAATETLDGDVSSVLCNVLRAVYGDEWSSGERETSTIRAALRRPAEAAVPAWEYQATFADVDGRTLLSEVYDTTGTVLRIQGGRTVGQILAVERRASPVPATETGQSREEVLALRDVAAERERQKAVEGWTAEHDDEHADGQMAKAAACYALSSAGYDGRRHWPWDYSWWKPTDSRRDLVKAAALILAEIERLDRRSLRTTEPNGGEGK